MPWILYSTLSIVYFGNVLSLDNIIDDDSEKWPWDLMAVIILILTVYCILIEIRQI